jgi:hypothetical protein
VITAKALVVLEEIAINPSHGAAEGMSKTIGMGRDAIQRAIKELREAGLVETLTYKTGARAFGRVLRPTQHGYHALKIRASILLNEQYSNLILNNNTFTSKKIVLDEVQGGDKTMSDEWYSLGQIEQDPDEIAELKRRDKERRDREYREARNVRAEKNMAANINRIPAHWTVDNAVYEFARRMIRWDIPPWESSRRPFQAAFARSRKDFNTNGEIEIIMMDIFFGRLDHEKKIKDPDMVWRLFIRDYNSLKIAAEQRVITPDSFAEAKELSKKQWEKF